jgi:hypothetical protein
MEIALIVFGPAIAYFALRPALIWVSNFILPPKPTEYERLQNAASKIQKAREQARRRGC